MGKRKPETPRSKIRSALRLLFLRSRERAAALKRDDYTCQRCRAKQSRAKGREVAVEVHHLAGVGNWELIINEIYRELLCSPDKMQTECKSCHEREHKDTTHATNPADG